MRSNNKKLPAEFFSKALKLNFKHFTSYESLTSNKLDVNNDLPMPNVKVQLLEVEKFSQLFNIWASKKWVDKRAVYRNRARRRIKAALRQVLQNQNVKHKKEIDSFIIFMCKKSAVVCPFEELVKEVEKYLISLQSRIQIKEQSHEIQIKQ